MIRDAPLGESERREVTLDDRALAHLHLGHDGPAEGGGGQPSPHRRVDPLVRRARRVWRRRSPLQLPADAPQRRRRRRHRRAARPRRLGRHRRALFGAAASSTTSCAGECTSFQYIGELCRYLVAAPPSAGGEARTSCRLALGNGLAADVWRAMRERFGELRVLEFYASTEGNVWLYNVEGRIGAIGRVPPYLAAREPIALARFDADAQAPLRGADGFCARCGDDEIGEALGRIGDEPQQRFEGYSEGRGDRKEDSAQRLQAGRRLDAHRRSDAPRRRRLLLFRRPHRRHVSLEGRERRDARSRQGLPGAGRRRRTRSSTASRSQARRAAPAWRCSRRRRARSRGFARAHGGFAALRAAAVPAPHPRDRDDRDLQAEARRLCRRRLRPGESRAIRSMCSMRTPAIMSRSTPSAMRRSWKAR